MKVIMDGFEIEGTPKEINELLELSKEDDVSKKEKLILYADNAQGDFKFRDAARIGFM